MTLRLAQQLTLCLAAFLFFGSATIGFKWVHSPYVWGYLAAGFGFLTMSILATTFR
jgi:hypothetical protein